MHYIMITLLSISMSTFLIYLLTNKLLRIHLKIKPLVFCACCAFFINIVLPRIIIGFVGVTETLGILAIFTIAFAYIIAYYNDSFSKKRNLSNSSKQTSLVVQVDANQYNMISIEEDNKYINNSLIEGENLTGIINQEKQSNQLADEFLWEKPEIMLVAVEVAAAATIDEDNNVGTLDYPSDSESSGEMSEVEESNDIVVISEEQENMEESIVPLENQLSAVSVTIAENDTLETLGFYPTSNDLDSLLDCAFMHKEQRKFIQALAVFRQALALYPNSEAAPFLVMEIGTILKNNGQYDEAISVLCEAKKLPGLQQSNTFELEFVKTIAYLRIVKNMLLQHHLGFISFNNIPEHVLKEIDAEFREWRNSA